MNNGETRESLVIEKSGLSKPLVQAWRRKHLTEGVGYTRLKSVGRAIVYTTEGLRQFGQHFQINLAEHEPDQTQAAVLRTNFLNPRIIQLKRLDNGEIIRARCRNAPDYKGVGRVLTVRWEGGQWVVPYRQPKQRIRQYVNVRDL